MKIKIHEFIKNIIDLLILKQSKKVIHQNDSEKMSYFGPKLENNICPKCNNSPAFIPLPMDFIPEAIARIGMPGKCYYCELDGTKVDFNKIIWNELMVE